MKYTLNKKIFWSNLILCILLVGSIIYTEGIDIITKKTEIITCPADALTNCELRKTTGEFEYLKPGETVTYNQFNQTKLNIVNYGVWVMLTISIIINHLLHNRKYPTRKELTKLYKKIKKTKIEI